MPIRPSSDADRNAIGAIHAHPVLRRTGTFELEPPGPLGTARRRGLGRALLAELVARCTDLGMRRMLAALGDTANRSSIRLHAAMRPAHAGARSKVGRKSDRRLDDAFMQEARVPGAANAPVVAG